MPTITIRLSDDEKTLLEAAARRAGQTTSDYVRESLDVRQSDDVIGGLNTRVEELWRRVAHLEELAGIDA